MHSNSFIDPRGPYSVDQSKPLGYATKFIPSLNNRSDGFISPGGQAAFTYTHTITYLDTVNGTLKNSLFVTAYPVCGGSITDVSDDGDDSDGNTTNDSTNVGLVKSTIDISSFEFTNLTTGVTGVTSITGGSSVSTDVLASQTVTFTVIAPYESFAFNSTNYSTGAGPAGANFIQQFVVSPTLSITWQSQPTTTTQALFKVEEIQPSYNVMKSANGWGVPGNYTDVVLGYS